MVAWWVVGLIAIGLNVISYLIMPKPKVAKPEAARDIETPTAEAGMPIPVVFGTITVKGVNVLHVSDKQSVSYEIAA